MLRAHTRRNPFRLRNNNFPATRAKLLLSTLPLWPSKPKIGSVFFEATITNSGSSFVAARLIAGKNHVVLKLFSGGGGLFSFGRHAHFEVGFRRLLVLMLGFCLPSAAPARGAAAPGARNVRFWRILFPATDNLRWLGVEQQHAMACYFQP